jgi:mannitol-specific phosphotransferase system IIBC component
VLKKVKKTLSGEKIQNILKKILVISFTIFTGIGGSIYFFGSLNNKIENHDLRIKNIELDMKNVNNNTTNTILQINQLNNKMIDNKLYIYRNYKNDEHIDKLLQITDDNYNFELINILNKKPPTSK